MFGKSKKLAFCGSIDTNNTGQRSLPHVMELIAVCEDIVLWVPGDTVAELSPAWTEKVWKQHARVGKQILNTLSHQEMKVDY